MQPSQVLDWRQVMATPLYKLWLARRFTEAWYQLSPDTQQSHFAQNETCAAELGVRRLLVCDSTWNSEQFIGWGIEAYPDLSTLQQYYTRLRELNWLRYLETETILGTPLVGELQELPKDGVFKVFLVRWAEAWHQLPKAERDDLWNRQLATAPLVGCTLYGFKARWSNESWIAWGIGCYPDLAAEQRHAELLEEMNWYRYADGQTTLGTRIQ
jgi:hypothetical protein